MSSDASTPGMRITYTSTNIAYNYRFAAELHRLGVLHAFITAASRFSPRSALPELGRKLHRRDFYQNLYLALLKVNAPAFASGFCCRQAIRSVDIAATEYAMDSDVFWFYRTTGVRSVRCIRSRNAKTLCVLEEVNSHVDTCHALMKEEYEKLGRGSYSGKFPDHGLRKEAYDLADIIYCPSSFVKKSFIEQGIPENKLLMINFGFSFPKGFCEVERPRDRFRMLYVGQLHFRKGLRYAIEAFRRVKHPNKEFLIVGPKTKVTGLEGMLIPDEVKFGGVLKGDALTKAYASATVFVLPTIEEGLALVIGEAMASGLPVVTTTHSGAEDLITNGLEGFIVPPADVNALTDALQSMADNPKMVDSMGAAASAQAKSLGGWDVATRKLVDEFALLIANAKR